jgi:uncharacterized RDD family membrane protein YckC
LVSGITLVFVLGSRQQRIRDTLDPVDDTQNPAPGWYQDPAGPAGQLRYFDGMQWTEHRAAAPAQHQMPYPSQPYGLPRAPVYAAAAPAKTTPDGRPLASWGVRLGAWLLDSLISGIVAGVFLVPLWISLIHGMVDNINHWNSTHPGGTSPSDPFYAYHGQTGTLIAIIAVTVVIQWIYVIGFWRWKQATPGKLMLGLRIEYRDHTGSLTWASILQRWLLQYGVALVYGLGGIFVLIDGLWPLWDQQSQALHEKWPKTNVVRTR